MKIHLFIFSYFVFICNLQAKEYEFDIKTKVDINDFSKRSTKSFQKEQIEFKSLSKHKYSEAVKILNKAISKYPNKNIFQNLSTIYLLDEIKQYSHLISGLYMDEENVIFLTYIDTLSCSCEDENFDLSAYELESTFHHEFNHHLIDVHFDNYEQKEKKEWKTKTKNTFFYLWTEYDLLKYSRNWKDEKKRMDNIYKKDTVSRYFFNENGYLTGYASVSFDEDIAVTSENMFMNRTDFWKFINENDYNMWGEDSDTGEEINPLLRKIRLTAKFYNFIEPEFSLEYFKSLK